MGFFKNVFLKKKFFSLASVLNDFTARYEDELTLKIGDSVKVIEIINENWVKCQNITENEQIGLVPISYLQIFLDNDERISLTNRNSIQSLDMPSIASKYVPWDNVFNTCSNKVDKTQNQPLVPSFEPFNVLEFEQKGNTGKKKEPPFRPPPPKITTNEKSGKKCKKSRNKEIFAIPNSNQSFNNLNNILNENLTEKSKVVQDLLATEIVYLFDLNAWESVIFKTILTIF